MRRTRGFTLLEILMVVVLAAILVGAAWELFNVTYKRVARTQSAANALQKALIVLERFGRDVEEMGHPPVVDRAPMRISTDGTALSFYVPVRPIDVTTVTVAYQPVVWGLKPVTRGLYTVQRDGRSLAGIRVTTWTFLFVHEGKVRLSERDVPLDGFWRGSLTESLPSTFVSTRTPKSNDAGELAKEAAAHGSVSEEEKASGPLASSLQQAGPLGHAGPFVYFRFTVVDEGGATATRAVLHDLVNVHMVSDHGHGFAWPDAVMKLTAPLVAPPGLPPEQRVDTPVPVGRESDDDKDFDKN